MSYVSGRNCPINYRYRPDAIAASPEQKAETLYVVGGLYGNLQALNAIENLVNRESGPVTICFNGDFNWFNVDEESFASVNRRVLAHQAILGNVEAELLAPGDEAGCGCAYPDAVGTEIVERSNQIHAKLKATASKHPDIVDRLRHLPMLRRYRIGNSTVGVVHGDAHSLAGWNFDVAALDDERNRERIDESFRLAAVNIFACTHTCLPVLRGYRVDGEPRIIINNGAAGMPNFFGDRRGLITRIGLGPAVTEPIYSKRIGDIQVAAIAIDYDQACWHRQFLSNWPEGSPAWISYIDRILDGPNYRVETAYAELE